jgi:ribosomal protein L11 methyltransferase
VKGLKSLKGKWIEIKVITKSEAVEPVSGIFYGLDVKGIAIEDPQDLLSRDRSPLSWDFADTDIFEYGGSSAVVKGYFSEDENIEKIVKYIEGKLNELKEVGIELGEAKVITAPVYEEDWSTAWKKYYKPKRLGKRILIKPIWEECEIKDNDILIQLDPGMAFGTGTHETTMMCIEFLEKYVKENYRVFDIGTGSGILAISAAKLGAKEVIGVDLDEVAVEAAKENVGLNNVNNIEIKHGNLVDVLTGKADIIVANIIAEVIIGLSKDIRKFMAENGLFIASGIIKDRKEDVLAAMKAENLDIIEVREMGEWVCIVAK